MNNYDFSEQVAVVTGGCNGIGAAVTQRLIDSQANVAIWDMDVSNPEDQISALAKDRCQLLQVDVTDHESVKTAVQQTNSFFGKN